MKNWNKNFNAYSQGIRQMLYKQQIKEQLSQEFANLEKLENAVKKIMGESGLPTWHNVPYLNFARQLYRLLRKHSGKTLKTEIKILTKTWQQRQLKKQLLVKIRNAIIDLFSKRNKIPMNLKTKKR
ncbi:MAG: hypothetical protein N2201_03470 [candidate division WOR-3 bacterium]|nr:hypothetical protein [candidate division WOR-3 bacterium]